MDGAHLDTRQKVVKIIETGEIRDASAPDQVLVSGAFQNAIPFAGHYRGGTNAGTGLLLEIVGTAGTLQITGPLGHMQLVPLSLHGAQGADKLAPLPVPEQLTSRSDAKGPAANVAEVYADLYADLTEGTTLAPTFSSAVTIHRVLAAIESAGGKNLGR